MASEPGGSVLTSANVGAPVVRSADADLAGLLAAYAIGAGSHVRANFVSTLDGHATGPDARSGSINSAADKVLFGALRLLADAVVLGAGTIRAEGYGRLRTKDEQVGLRREAAAAAGIEGRSTHPTLVVVTASGEVPDKVLRADRGDTGDVLVLVAESTRRGHLIDALGGDHVVVCGQDTVDPGRAVAALRERGLHQLLTEGGPRLFGDWVEAGVVDELCLTVRPLLTGGGGHRILTGGGGALPTEGRLLQALEIEGDLMLRVALR